MGRGWAPEDEREDIAGMAGRDRRETLRPLVKSPRLRSRLALLTTVLFPALAVVSWWMVVEDGPSPARVTAAIATTAGAIVQGIVHVRGRRLFRA
jgi:hypothetical protein